MAISQLGYLGFGVGDVDAWTAYATDVLGMEVAERAQDGTVYLRMDEHHHRISLYQDRRDDLAYVGMQTANREAFEETKQKLYDGGVEFAQGSDADIVGRIMYGIFLDVTGRKQAEEGHELLAGEMSHRVKNLLAIAAGLTAITSRSAASATDMARELTHRLTALGRAHDLVRPLPGDEGKAALLGDLITVLLAPYDDMGAFSGRVRVSVPRMGVGEKSATTLALVIHELATNSLKYGALSAESGTLDVSCNPNDREVVVVWTERGGPPVAHDCAEKCTHVVRRRYETTGGGHRRVEGHEQECGHAPAVVLAVDVEDREDDQVGEDEREHAAEADPAVPQHGG